MLRRVWTTKPFAVDLGLLLLRLMAGALMLQYGWKKLSTFNEGSVDFPDPLGVSSPVSLSMTIFAEFFCSCFLLAGLFTRIVLIPLIFAMTVAVLVIHSDDPFRVKEHA